ncbi:hypothetical protein [Pseudomonas syringae]|uniref:Uncharacterized protein n=1 Tax=Pseudomonas syringae pv. papulans TaxID=83963 RepID=A0AA43ISP3_PSESX|nr:hypothetical protein [Pseudomonas syringae]KWS41965.1 hypothetical protein AL059_19695 [Pseudomonas syringae pv. papulans]MDH4602854.1 hypothetical protein [Pseudomonas syringae pv. papulans]MDH4621467.1 hypothetical protein [Pseudomonas syringae pv. papulans]
MSFQITTVSISEDGRLLVSLKSNASGTQTQIWVTPTTPINNLTISEIEQLAKQEAAKEHTC